MNAYKESDYVKVVDEQGNDLPPVPKAWVGTDLLPPGVKKKTARNSRTSTEDSSPESDDSSS